MLVYSKENYNSFGEFKRNLINELKQAFCGSKVSYGNKDAYFADFAFSVSNLGEQLTASLDVNGNLKTVVITLALNSGALKLNEDINIEFNSYIDILAKSTEIRNKQIQEEAEEAVKRAELAKQLFAEERARREEIKKQKEADLKYARKVKKALDKLNSLKPEKTASLFETPASQYEVIGWMAKHLTSVKAAMPDYMESWFVQRFGDVERYVVNSKKKTSGGFAYQWGLGLKLTFDTEVKGPLEQRATSTNKKVIDNVAFVWDLIESYGFQFGKEQDISKIKAEVPESNLADFEKGYAM